MAAVPPVPPHLAVDSPYSGGALLLRGSGHAAGGDGAPCSVFSFATNELGRRSFFPSSDISAAPTLNVRHSRHLGGAGRPKLTAAAALNEEHYSAGAGLSHRIAGCDLSAFWTRVFQREAEIYDKEDRGWQQEYSIRTLLARNTAVQLSLLRNATDCRDKDMVDLSLGLEHRSSLGTVSPTATFLSRAAPAGVESEQRKTGRVAQLMLRTHPDLVRPGGPTFYLGHNYRKFDDEPGHHTNEAGVTLPFAAGRLTVGALQCGKEQRELLERTSLASAPLGEGQVGLKVEFEAEL
eukprot:TRINITY_DN29536_c0_g2_i1.p1 TRINITY_DN29536_c0_g2~~TRINITY_DN29536_c0_g2_i1.p1  ORF type:complete len:316 (+),score=97.69 TRINITY_DN29536_c0_g2_i1:70-948(+)